MKPVETLAHYAAGALEVAGIVAILGGAFLTFVTAVVLLRRRQESRHIYFACRGQMGRSILVGLELLVAADIVNTVAVEPSLRSVAVLSIIVLIRTFLSLTLEVEMNGRWPWQGPAE